MTCTCMPLLERNVAYGRELRHLDKAQDTAVYKQRGRLTARLQLLPASEPDLPAPAGVGPRRG